MASLKSTIVDGTLVVTDKIRIKALEAYSSATTTTSYTLGSSGYVLRSTGTGAYWQYVSDSSSAGAISSSNTYLVTERDVYYGLPTINGGHSYNSSTNYYVAAATGSSGQILTWPASGNTPVWANPAPTFPAGGTTGQALVKNSNTDNDVKWATIDTSTAENATRSRYLTCPDTRSTNPAPGDYTATTTGFSCDFKQGSVIGLTTANYSGVITFRPYAGEQDWSGGDAHQIACNNAGLYWRHGGASWGNWARIWVKGDSVTGAVWNDYAEYRNSTCNEPGYCVQEFGDDSLVKTQNRLDHFAGVTSDTWGFAQGETKDAKTPIAVAGRVLVYTFQDRDKYKPGDCVCTAPNGTVDIMTRDEIIQYPDRIVGTVSCVPDYDTWGGGEDRQPIQVNGRIWIKVR